MASADVERTTGQAIQIRLYLLDGTNPVRPITIEKRIEEMVEANATSDVAVIPHANVTLSEITETSLI